MVNLHAPALSAGPHPALRRILLPVLLVLVALVYWPGLGGGFVFDDYPNIVQNGALHVTWASTWLEWLAAVFSSPASELQRPLAMLTFAINHALTGLDPYWMKLTNLVIHLVNTVLVLNVVRLLLRLAEPDATSSTGADRVALWVAAAWALTPINLMAVLFVVQRMESLSHAFVFGGLYLYLLGRQAQCAGRGGWWLVLSGLLGGTVLGVLSKESAVLLPMYALVLEWAILKFGSARQAPDRRLLALFGTVLVLPALLGLGWMIPKVLDAGAYAGRGFDLGERLLTEGRVLVDYLHWTLLPNLGQLSLYHDDYAISRGLLDPPATLMAFVFLAALLAAAVWLRKRRPLMALGLGWFFSAHLLTATIWPLELVFEHRNYFASLGLCLAMGDLLLRAPPSARLRRAGAVAAVGLLVLYAGLTTLRSLEWSNPLRFAMTEVAKHPSSPRATYDLARDLVLLSEFDPASSYVDPALAALERARRVPRATALPEAAAIVLAARTGRRIDPEWWTSLQDKLRTGPIGAQENNALRTIGNCVPARDCRLPDEQVVATFQAALRQVRNPETLGIFGHYALDGLHDPALALALWQEAASLAPGAVQYQEKLARLLIASGRFEEASVAIANVRRLGRLGQNEALARALETASRRARSKSGTVD